MRGMMMDFPLTLVPILERAEKFFGEVEIVSRQPDRSLARPRIATCIAARGGWLGRWNLRAWRREIASPRLCGTMPRIWSATSAFPWPAGCCIRSICGCIPTNWHTSLITRGIGILIVDDVFCLSTNPFARK